MAATFLAALALASLACCLADPLPKNDIRWCTVSPAETKKCRAFKDAASYCNLNCVQKSNTHDCIASIANDEADAISLDGGHVYDAGLKNLKPVMVESYGTDEEKDTCYYAVAVVKKGSGFQFSGLKGKTSCHTGLDKTAGWNMPIGAFLKMDLIKWEGSDDKPLQKAVSAFFSESCVPGAQEPNLCSLCAGKGDSKCTLSHREPYSGYDGAFKCLTDGKGVVAFVKHLTVPVSQSDKYELLCPDDTRKPLSEYKDCNLGRVPAHAVVTRSSGEKSSAIRECLTKAQADFGKKGSSPFHLFSSPDGIKDLVFKDSATRVIPLPESMDATLFLGTAYSDAIQYVRKVSASPPSDEKKRLRWCVIGKAEKEKCDTWSAVSGNAIACAEGAGTEECIVKIQRSEADAMALDGGYMYTAGQCGLVPALTEYYDTADLSPCRTKGSTGTGTYYAVAVVKKSNQDITWDNLKGKKSCHTAVGRTAGWNIPMGQLMKEEKIKDCKFDEFFSESCAPGSDPKSNLCKLCAGSPGLKGEENKCQANNKEQHYGYSGSFRCLVAGGDVAFVKHTTVLENCDGANPADWAKNLKCNDYELLCPNGKRAALSEYKTCHLAQVPAHGVVTRPDMKPFAVQMLSNQQSLFGREGAEKAMFEMYVSEGGKDLVFKDSTQCLLEVPSGKSMEDVLGKEYSSAVAALKKCSSKSDLHAACTFHSCT